MSSVLGSLLSDLRLRGVEFGIEGDQLIVDAPAGTLTEADRAALRATKPDLLKALDLERQLAGMSIGEFEQSSLRVEIRVPWLDVTLWWVPRQEHALALVRAGVAAGRVYTARDLTNLTRLTEHAESRSDIERVAKLKLAFDATIVSVDDDDPAPPNDQPLICPACHQHRFWRSIHGVVVCGKCHAPAHPDLVAEWLDGGDTP